MLILHGRINYFDKPLVFVKCIYCSAVLVNLNKPLLGVYVELNDYAFTVYYSNTVGLIPRVQFFECIVNHFVQKRLASARM